MSSLKLIVRRENWKKLIGKTIARKIWLKINVSKKKLGDFEFPLRRNETWLVEMIPTANSNSQKLWKIILPYESFESSENLAMLLRNSSSEWRVLRLTTGNSCMRCLIAFSCKCLLRISNNNNNNNNSNDDIKRFSRRLRSIYSYENRTFTRHCDVIMMCTYSESVWNTGTDRCTAMRRATPWNIPSVTWPRRARDRRCSTAFPLTFSRDRNPHGATFCTKWKKTQVNVRYGRAPERVIYTNTESTRVHQGWASTGNRAR